MENKLGRKGLILLIAAVVIAAIVIIIAVVAGRKPPEFESASDFAKTYLSGEERVISFSADGLGISVRVSDICSQDEDGNMVTDLSYSSGRENSYDREKKYVFMDFVIENRTSKDFTVNNYKAGRGQMFYLAYFQSKSDKHNENGEDFACFGEICDPATKEVSGEDCIVIPGGGTRQFTLQFFVYAEYVGKLNEVYYGGEFVEDFSKYEVLNVPRPIFKKDFENSELLPELTKESGL